MTNYHRIALVTAICLGTFMASLDISIVNVALPSMQSALHTDMSGLQWVIDAYALCLSAFILSSGPLGDRFGRKRLWLSGILLFTLGSLICALSSTMPALLTGRVIQGIAAAAVIPGALSLLVHAFPDQRLRVKVIGIWSAVNALSLVAGPVFGGILVHWSGWHAIFIINLPVGIIALLLGIYGLQESANPQHAAFDPIGQILSILWLGALTLGLITAGEHGWYSSIVLGYLGSALVLFVLFIIVEHQVKRPLLALTLFRQTDFRDYNIASGVLGFSAYSSVFFVSLFFQQVQGLNALETGWRMAPEFIAMALFSACSGFLAARLRIQWLAVAGYSLMGIGLLVLAGSNTHSGFIQISGGLVLLGAGMGVCMPAISALVMGAVPAHSSGLASATMNALRQTGMTVGIAWLGTLMSLHALSNLTQELNHQHWRAADVTARAAIIDHQMQPDITGLTHQAFAGGFSVAMYWAGSACLLMACYLLIRASHAIRHPQLSRNYQD